MTSHKGRNLLVWFTDSELEVIREAAAIADLAPEEYVHRAALLAAGIAVVESSKHAEEVG